MERRRVKIRSRAPLRLGIAGGGTDVSPYCDVHGGHVLNATINRYAYAVIKTNDDGRVKFNATDLQKSVEFDIDAFPFSLKGDLILHKAVYNHLILAYNDGKPLPLELRTFCDAPAGSGLGSSSTLVVAMIQAFVELFNLGLDDHAVAQMAFDIERVQCNLQGGRQDQYAATFGGFNFMEFYEDNRAVINSLRLKEWIICELEASLVMFFSGISRESAKIIEDQSKNVNSGPKGALQAMHGVKEQARIMKENLLRGDFDGYVEAMRIGWQEKKRSAKTVSTPYLDEIFDSAIEAGASAGKVSGAGGGGFMMFFVPTEKRMDVIRRLNLFEGGHVSNCHFTPLGSQAWRVK